MTALYPHHTLPQPTLAFCTVNTLLCKQTLYADQTVKPLCPLEVRGLSKLCVTVRLGAHWQLNCCGDKTVAVNVRAMQRKSCLYWQLFFFQYRMDFTETACVCALLLRIRTDRRKKRHWVYPAVSKIF